jgi:uncharacterized protein (DUF58 family)
MKRPWAQTGTSRRPGLLRRMAIDIFRFKITRQGWVLIASLIVTVPVSLMTFQLPVYNILIALVFFLGISEIVSVTFWPRCRVEGQLPEKLVAGLTTKVNFTLKSSWFLSAYDLSIGFFSLPSSIREIDAGKTIRRLGPGQSAVVPVELQALRRGLYEFDGPRYYTTFPFNLTRSGSWAKGSCRVTVLPEYHPISLAHLPVRSRYQPGGILFTSNIGESCEYIGNREYRPGDMVRRIDYRSWARLARPVVREYQEEYYCRIALVLDTYVPRGRRKGPRGFAELEAAVSLSASVAEAISHGEYILDIFAAGPELYVFRSGRHLSHLDNVMEILAGVQECRQNPFDVVAPALAGELGNISTVIFILLDWDESRRDLVRQVAEAGCATKTVVIHKGMTSLLVDADAATMGVTLLTPQQVQAGELDLS